MENDSSPQSKATRFSSDDDVLTTNMVSKPDELIRNGISYGSTTWNTPRSRQGKWSILDRVSPLPFYSTRPINSRDSLSQPSLVFGFRIPNCNPYDYLCGTASSDRGAVIDTSTPTTLPSRPTVVRVRRLSHHEDPHENRPSSHNYIGFRGKRAVKMICAIISTWSARETSRASQKLSWDFMDPNVWPSRHVQFVSDVCPTSGLCGKTLGIFGFTISTAYLCHLNSDDAYQDYFLMLGIVGGISAGLATGLNLEELLLQTIPWAVLLSLMISRVAHVLGQWRGLMEVKSDPKRGGDILGNRVQEEIKLPLSKE